MSSEINNELLISEVQKREVLWNKKSKQYKNRFLVEAAWEEVSNEMKLPKDEIKAKWKNLRDTFNKEIRKIPTPRSGDGGEGSVIEYRGRWQHFSQLLFLKEIPLPRPTEGNLLDHLEGTQQTTTSSQPIEVVESSRIEILHEGNMFDSLYFDPEDEVAPTAGLPNDEEIQSSPAGCALHPKNKR